MSDLENYLLSALFLVILVAAFYFWKISRKKSSNAERHNFIMDTLEQARAQFEVLNIKLPSGGNPRAGLSAMIQEIGKDGLNISVSDYVSDDWLAKPVDVYFRISRDNQPVSYVFHSVIRKIRADYENSDIQLSMPMHLQVEKKRHFARVKPLKDDVRVIGVWPLTPGRRLPVSVNDMGKPLTHYKPGMEKAPVQMENISGSGLALRFPLDKDGRQPFDFSKGSQLVCLVIFVTGDSRPTAFWCTGEVMNSRIDEGQNRAFVVGIEFTNWAVLEQKATEIHWAHSSPSRGARPILRWVDEINKNKNNQFSQKPAAAQPVQTDAASNEKKSA